MFSVEYRERVRDYTLMLASQDARVVAGAVVGSLALEEGDRWSDLDLTFGVADGIAITSVLEDWTARITAEFDAAQLFDLPSGPSLYRVLLLPGCLQFDLSFTPAANFGATGPKFRLLFGQAVERPFYTPAPARDLFGYAVHHALRARFCLERGRVWQAEYWISSLRDYGLSLACQRRGLPVAQGRGFDRLPADVLARFSGALAASFEPGELRRSLKAAIDGLLAETDGVDEIAAQTASALRELTEQEQ